MIRLAFALVLLATTAAAQQVDPAAFADLRADGNDRPELRAAIAIGIDNLTAANAFSVVADRARLNLTFDPRLPGLETRVTLLPRKRTVAGALLEIAKASRVVVRVSSRGQMVVVAASQPVVANRSPQRADTTTQQAVALPAVRTEDVRAEHRAFVSEANLGAATITARELRATPSFVEPDVLRSVQLLPGISARSDWTAGFNVRGGEGDQSLVMIDGMPIYTPFHLGGVFSTFIDRAVGRVELRKGTMPARFGGRLSGVLDVQSAEPTSGDTHGTVDVSLVSSSASVGRRFAEGNGSWLVAARRTYADAVVNLLKRDAFPYHFQDAQVHATRQFSNGVRLAMTGYTGVDALTSATNENVSGGWGNSVIGGTVGRAIPNWLGDSTVIEQRVSLTRFDAHVDVDSYLFHTNNRVADLRASGTIAAHRARSTTTLGYELMRQTLAYHGWAGYDAFGDIFPLDSLSHRMTVGSAFADHVWKPTGAWIIQAGARLDVVRPMAWSGLSPRIAVKRFLSPTTAITAGAGSHAQWVHSMGREEEPIQPLQFWVGSDSLRPVSRARDVVAGVETWFSGSRFLHVEAFYKRYDDLLIPNAYSDPRVDGDEFIRASGTSYGLDVLLRQLDVGGFSGWAAYTYAFGSRVRADDGTRFYPSQDRRHNLNLVGSWRRGSYSLGARANLASGLPVTPSLGGFLRDRYDPIGRRWIPTSGYSTDQTIAGAYNSVRLPRYWRLDVSASRTGRLYGATVTPYASIVNVFNTRNPAAYLYSFGSRRGDRGSFPNLPFAPTFGVSLAY